MSTFGKIQDIARKRAGGASYSVCQLPYGYAVFLEKDSRKLQEDEDKQNEKQEIKALFSFSENKNIDAGRMREVLDFFAQWQKIPQIPVEIQMYVEATEKSDTTSALGCLRKLHKALPSLFAAFEPETLSKISAETAARNALGEESQPDRKTLQTESASKIREPLPSQTQRQVREPVATEGSEAAVMNFSALSVQCGELYHSLEGHILGQSEAIRQFVRGFFESELLKDSSQASNTPRGVYLFVGPPGVGKTYLAEEAAVCLNRPCMRFNMSEYADHQSQTELIGLSKKYQGAARGRLTSYVKKNPECILIFDEIEKAHRNVIHLFLQILDAGVLQDEYEEKDVSFENSTIIFTTNVGKSLYEDGRGKNLSLLPSAVILDALEKELHPLGGWQLFPSSICSRLMSGNVIMFNYLSCHHLQAIAERHFLEASLNLQERFGCHMELDQWITPIFLFSHSSGLDARIVSFQSAQMLRNEIYEYGRRTVDRLDLGKVERFRFIGNINDSEPEIRSLFINDKNFLVLILGETDPKEEKHIPIQGKKLETVYAGTAAEAKKILSEKEVTLVLIDTGYQKEREETEGTDLDELNTEGYQAFRFLRQYKRNQPVFILDPGRKMMEADKAVLLQQGAREILAFDPVRKEDISDRVLRLAEDIYIQDNVDDCSRRGRRLQYNTFQKLTDDGKTAVIEFGDFRFETVVTTDNKSFVMDGVNKPEIRFSDVIGAANAKEELNYFIYYLKNSENFVHNNLKPARGILLYGPPGTGKTMLAKAMAGEARATFFPANATDFMNKYVGEGEAKIRKVFSAARKYAPSVIFIDEIDAIAKERTGEFHTETLLNTLLSEMDGFVFDPLHPVFVLAATNYPLDKEKAGGKAVIDSALLRRFDNKIYVDLPNQEERKEYLNRKLALVKDAQVTDEAIENVAVRTTGESLSNLENVLSLAGRKAQRENENLTDRILLEALEEYAYGEKKHWGRDYYQQIARHEAGHAYICYLSGEKPSFVTIVSRGDFGGYMQHGDEEKKPVYTREELCWKIRISLAGRAAEEEFYGREKGVNTGVSSDLTKATRLALQMICSYGMEGDKLLSLEIDKALQTTVGEKILDQADQLLSKEMEKTRVLVKQGRERIHALAELLLEKNQLMGDEVQKILDGMNC